MTNTEVLDAAIKEIKEYKDEAFDFKQHVAIGSPEYQLFDGHHKAYVKTIKVLEGMKKKLK
jgi:hypothetical protein